MSPGISITETTAGVIWGHRIGPVTGGDAEAPPPIAEVVTGRSR
jgi:hypothetical protein